ncbi:MULTISPECIES: YidB family protein [unclassified Duganella]|uniref:YidB family protein n=1 Tax=unclassified Duganella TaxID=2636909 RepID=UPI001E41EDD4|nr:MULTISPECIES: YidB family protein [unclassified Duganella]
MMSLLDQLAGQVLGSLGGGQQGEAQQGNLLSGVMAMIDNAGGVPAVLEQLKQSGLADQVMSWVGTGANQAISGSQLEQALGSDQLQQIAGQAGIDPQHVSSGLASLLPQIIDQLTPHGEVPADGLLAQGLNLLKARLSA